MSKKQANPRRLALDVLLKMSFDGGDGGYSNILTDAAVKRTGIEGADRALMNRLVCGVAERYLTLEYVASRLTDRNVRKLDRDVLLTIMLGIYQLAYADKIPTHAAVNETVALARPSCRGFVNAVLREYIRRGSEIEIPRKNEISFLSIKYSVNGDLVRALISDFGSERTARLLASFERENRLTLRVNTERISRDELASRLAERGISAEKTRFSPFGLRLAPGAGLPGEIDEGLCFVQDEASQICVCALAPAPGNAMLDVCSCPGTKTFSSALMMQNKGEIVACDLHASKLPLIERGAKKLGINVIKTRERDSSIRCAEFDGRFDRVLCDVPCSGFGVISKKPEIRYRSPNATSSLPQTQRAILESASRALAVGSCLVYSTCTLLKRENEDVVADFLARHENFSLTPFTVGELSCDGQITLTPDVHGADGFFIAKLTKKA